MGDVNAWSLVRGGMGELTIDQLLFNRPFPGYVQYRMPIKNTYMCAYPRIRELVFHQPVVLMQHEKSLWI
jgi:hypothetical protein